MHAGEPRGKWGIELFCICNSYVCQCRSASCHCCLQESSSAQQCHCWMHQRWEADQSRYDWGCAYVSQPLVAASGNHPLVDGVAALVPWLISSSSLNPTSFLHRDHALYSCISMHAAVDCIPESYRQNQDSNPTLHNYLLCFPLSNYR